MKVPTIKQCLGSALMLTALVVGPAILKASSANALPPAVVEELDLTSEQEAELDSIREDGRAQAEAVLTDEQLSVIDGTEGNERRQAIQSLDLSEDQRAQLREIYEESRTAADEVLTEEQKDKLREMQGNRGSRQRR